MVRKIGKYQIQGEIGRGGFGQVYRAFDPTVNRVVAIKVLTSDGDAELLHRFQNEAAAAGNLHHRNIVTIHEFGEEAGVPYMVMEFLEGKDLHQAISGGDTLTLLQKMQIMSQVADGLHYAHKNGVIHRDVKPANIMLLPDGSVKIMDFGIARITQSNVTRQTRAGFLIGTIQYMCPEQFEGMEADALFDLWAFGAIYYQLITGRQPFRGTDTVKLMYQITNVDPDRLSSLNPECPEGLEQIVHRSLAKDRSQRYQSLEDLKFDVEPILLSLQHQYGNELLTEAHASFAAGDFEQAQRTVRRVLELDASNRDARQLRSEIYRQLDRLSMRAKLGALVEKSEEALKANRLSDAIDLLESASRLDPLDAQVAARLSNAKSAKAVADRTALLLSEAQQSFFKQDLTGAWKSVNEALAISPENKSAFELSEKVGDQIRRREKENLFREELNKIRGFLLLGEFKEAMRNLEGLARDHPGSPELADLLNRAQNQKSAFEQRERLGRERAQINDLLRQSRVTEAIGRIREACRAFPEERDLPVLLRHTLEELQSREQTEQKLKLKQEAEALLNAGKFSETLPILENGLKTFSGDLDLIHLLQTALKAKAAHEREMRIRKAVGEGENLRSAGQLPEAFRLVEASRRELGDDTRLISLNQELQSEWERQKREDAIRTAAQNVQQLIDQGRPNSALIMIQQITEKYPGDPQIASLLLKAEEELHRHERNQSRERLMVEAWSLADACEFDRALEILAEGSKEFPDEPVLRDAEKSIQTRKTELERQRVIDNVLRQAQALRGEQKFAAAVDLLLDSLKKFGEDRALVGLKVQVVSDLEVWNRGIAFKAVESRARKLMDSGDFAGAANFLRPRIAEFSGDALITGMLRTSEEKVREQEDRRLIRDRLAQAEGLERQGRPAEALKVLENAVGQFPNERQLSLAIQTLDANIKKEDRSKEVARHSAIIEGLIRQSDWPGALKAVEEARAKSGGDARFDELFEQITLERAKREQQRLRLLAETLGKAAEFEQQGELKPALRVIEGSLAQFPNAKELLESATRLRAQIAAAEKTERINQQKSLIQVRLSNHEFDAALEVIARAQQEFPGEPAFQRLLESAREAKRLHSLSALVIKIEQRKAAGDLDAATALVTDGLRTFSKEPRLQSFKEELNWERLRVSSVEKAKEFISRNQLDKAENILRGVLAKKPQDPECSALMRAVTENRAEQKAFQPAEKAAAVASSLPRRQIAIWTTVACAVLIAVIAGFYWREDAPVTKDASVLTVGSAPNNTSVPAAVPVMPPAPAPPEIDTSALSFARVAESYEQKIAVSGGTAPHTFGLSSGQLPPGLSLEPSGRIKGTPLKAGKYDFRAKVTDHSGLSSERTFTLTTVASVLDAKSKPAPSAFGMPLTASSTGLPAAVSTEASAPNPPPQQTTSNKIEGPKLAVKVEDPAAAAAQVAANSAVPAGRPFTLGTYGGLRKGSFSWINTSGFVGRVTIEGRNTTPGKVNGRTPELGIPFRVIKTTPQFKIEQQTGSPRLVFQVDGDVKQVVIEWEVYQP